uniref:Transposase n=1 Tax=Acrobeloides nanus TaxID=290746 RepID=A0A914EA38_9BILA
MSKKKREAIVALHAEGCTTKDIEKLLKVPIRTVQNVLKRYRETGSTDDRHRSGRPRTSCTPENKHQRTNKKESWRKEERELSRELGIADGSVRNIVKKDLKLKSIKLQKTYVLTPAIN